MQTSDFTIRSVLLFVAVLLSVGCATQTFDPDKAPEYSVKEDHALFYRLGPQQGRGPEAALMSGARVRMLRREFGYSFVEIEDGRTGYMANEQLEPAPPTEEKPAHRPASKRSSRQTQRTTFDETWLENGPDFSVLPEALDVLHPASEPSPSTDSSPQFRY
jgi:hypothetical protein